MMSATTDEFTRELRSLLVASEQMGLSAVELTAGALHRRVGGYPRTDHRMPSCCGAMRKAMSYKDIVVSEPEQGAGASLRIRYQLPR